MAIHFDFIYLQPFWLNSTLFFTSCPARYLKVMQFACIRWRRYGLYSMGRLHTGSVLTTTGVCMKGKCHTLAPDLWVSLSNSRMLFLRTTFVTVYHALQWWRCLDHQIMTTTLFSSHFVQLAGSSVLYLVPSERQTPCRSIFRMTYATSNVSRSRSLQTYNRGKQAKSREGETVSF